MVCQGWIRESQLLIRDKMGPSLAHPQWPSPDIYSDSSILTLQTDRTGAEGRNPNAAVLLGKWRPWELGACAVQGPWGLPWPPRMRPLGSVSLPGPLRPAASLPPSPGCHQTDLILLFVRAFEIRVLVNRSVSRQGSRWGPRASTGPRRNVGA